MVGLWLIGGSGNVATVVSVGLAALRRGLSAPTGLVTELPALAGIDLVAPADLALGGCDLRAPDLLARARRLAAEDRVLAPRLVEEVSEELARQVAALQAGVGPGAGPGAIAAIQDQLRRFADAHRLDRVVVVNLASTEPPHEGALPDDPAALRASIEAGGVPVPPSLLYALATLELGWAYVNFTPSLGASTPAADHLALERGAVHAGRDGKTGQTLLKTALAPLLASRHLHVLSWYGQNLLGNPDGATLDDAGARRSKQRSKGDLLPALLGHEPAASAVDIRYLPPLGDWKIAWDHILFEGFLGARMSLQLTWQGADSLLAAPLVIDLARLCDRALRRGERGALGYLAPFFKEPIAAAPGSHEHHMDLLLRHLAGPPGPDATP